MLFSFDCTNFYKSNKYTNNSYFLFFYIYFFLFSATVELGIKLITLYMLFEILTGFKYLSGVIIAQKQRKL